MERPKFFYFILGCALLLGGIATFIIPERLICQSEIWFTGIDLKSTCDRGQNTAYSSLRTTLLTITGGILALITLLENIRKTDIENNKANLDREKYDNDREKYESDKRDALVADRRKRYMEYINKFTDITPQSQHINQSAVYSLIKLADEWARDKYLESREKLSEVQAIINDLCFLAVKTSQKTSTRSLSEFILDEIFRKERYNIWVRELKLQESKLYLNLSGSIFEKFPFTIKHLHFDIDFTNSTFKTDVDFYNSNP